MKAHQENVLELFTGPQSQPGSNPFAILLALVAHYSRFLNQGLSNLSHKATMMEVKTSLGSLGIGSRLSFSPQESNLKGIHHTVGNLCIAVCAAEYEAKVVTFLQITRLSLLCYSKIGW